MGSQSQNDVGEQDRDSGHLSYTYLLGRFSIKPAGSFYFDYRLYNETSLSIRKAGNYNFLYIALIIVIIVITRIVK